MDAYPQTIVNSSLTLSQQRSIPWLLRTVSEFISEHYFLLAIYLRGYSGVLEKWSQDSSKFSGETVFVMHDKWNKL